MRLLVTPQTEQISVEYYYAASVVQSACNEFEYETIFPVLPRSLSWYLCDHGASTVPDLQNHGFILNCFVLHTVFMSRCTVLSPLHHQLSKLPGTFRGTNVLPQRNCSLKDLCCIVQSMQSNSRFSVLTYALEKADHSRWMMKVCLLLPRDP